MDFIVVPTVRFRLLYVWFVIGHGSREIRHFGVTTHPASPWVVQQLREAFPDNTTPRFLIYDNDSIFSDRVTESSKNIGIEPQRTAYQSRWQNGIAERWVGSARRELLNHVIVMNERHLHYLLREYVDYYNEDRVHTRLRAAPRRWPSSSLRVAKSSLIGVAQHLSLRARVHPVESRELTPVAETVARLTTGSGGLPLAGRVLHPLDDESKSHGVIAFLQSHPTSRAWSHYTS